MIAGHRLRNGRAFCDAHERVCDVWRVYGAGVYRLRKLVLHGGASYLVLRLSHGYFHGVASVHPDGSDGGT